MPTSITAHRTLPVSRSARHSSRQILADGSPERLVGLKNLKKANDALIEEVSPTTGLSVHLSRCGQPAARTRSMNFEWLAL